MEGEGNAHEELNRQTTHDTARGGRRWGREAWGLSLQPVRSPLSWGVRPAGGPRERNLLVMLQGLATGRQVRRLRPQATPEATRANPGGGGEPGRRGGLWRDASNYFFSRECSGHGTPQACDGLVDDNR